MADPNASLLDALIRHAVYLGRYTRSEIATMLETIGTANESLISSIMRGVSPADRDRILADVEKLYGTAIREATDKLTAGVKELAGFETERAAKLAQSVNLTFKLPSPVKVLDAIMENPADRGNPMKVLFDKFERNTIERIQAVVRQGITEGQAPVQMVKALRGEVVKPARWIMKDGKRVLRPGVYRGGVYETTTRGAETLARTVVMHTYNTVNEQVYKDNADLLSGVKWVATLDMNTCPDCGALDGEEWEVDERHSIPPLHPNCLPGDTLISSSSKIAAISKRKYHGNLFVIRTASGLELRCTPNHPILTDSGFVPAQSLNFGQNVIRDAGVDRVILCGKHKNDMVSSIEELTRSFLKSGKMTARKVPVSSEDFHNDAVDDEVAVVFADWKLFKKINISFSQFRSESNFVFRRCVGSVLVSFYSALLKLILRTLYSFDSLMCGISKSLSFFWSCVLHSNQLLLSPAARFDSGIAERSNEHLSSNANLPCNTRNTDTGIKQSDGIWKNTGYIDSPVKSKSKRRKSSINDVFTDSVLASHILAGHFGPIVVDQIIEIVKYDFSGHVYNLQTKKGFYIANGIITHNCRCVTVPVVKGHASPDSPRFEDWLSNQSVERQDDILGKGRAEIFRSGEHLSDMSDQGKMLTLAELKERGE